MASTTTAVGSAALSSLSTGTDNVAVGTKALTSNSTGSENVSVGSGAGSHNSSGSQNIIIGYDSASTLASGSNNIVIAGDVPTSSTSNYLNIGGVITGDMSTGAITLANGFKATTQSPGDNSTKIATTAYVDAAGGSGTVTSVAASGSQGVTISGSPITTSGTIAVGLGNITPTSVAATGTVTGSNLSGTNTGDQTITLTSDVTGSGTGSFATTIKSNVALAGSPTTTTQTAGDNSTKIATTAYVDAAIAGPGNSITLGTPQATTSGTSITFTGIPSNAKRVCVNFLGVKTSGSSDILIRIGPSGGVVSTGYLAAASNTGGAFTAYTTGFGTRLRALGYLTHGTITLSLENSSNNSWASSGVLYHSGSSAETVVAPGSISLSGSLNKLSITTLNGTDTFAGGEVNISYE